MTAHLLLVEDNEMLGSTLVDNFQMENYHIDWVKDGKEGLDVACSGIHDLIILDIMLPHLNGFEILKKLRTESSTPVIILSAKGQFEDRIQGLELRADDYMTKPFQFKELLLRVQNILRRHHATPEARIEILKIGQATFNLKALTVETPDTKDIISEKESLMLRLLYNHRNQVVSREKILDTVWGTQNYPSARTIDNFIVTLRKWIENNPSDPAFIISHRGVGYSLQLKDNS